ncbi:hypothetical protein M9H77_26322 [Catharanthus roseus]|uniref:Uncharacterized protein n=1 Tax=Catharanthus roseus TaxID=4058 RepID=A0ACC0AA77_CATRO|nr:hypothetical protein M9H77_26322 [Catharanthus roseus]
MVLEQPRRKDIGLDPVVDRSGQTHGCMVTASSTGLRNRQRTSDVPTTPSQGMFHGSDASGSLVLPSSIPTRIRMPHDPHTPQGYYDTSKQMLPYAPRSTDVQHCQGDDMIVQARRDYQGLDVGEGLVIRVRRKRGIWKRKVLRREEVYMYPLQGVQGD